MRRLLLDFSGSLIRSALIENTSLCDLIIESKENRSIVSNIYVGIVKNILPSQFVFLDIGIDKNAFLQLNDKKNSGLYKTEANGKKKLQIKIGQEILVQVLKDADGTKGACVTTQLSFTGNLVVLLTNITGVEIGISKKISDPDERLRLKKIANSILPENFGIIMRTQCENLSEDQIKTELINLLDTANQVLEKARYIKGLYAIYKENHRAERAIKELFRSDIEEVILNDETELENVKEIIKNITQNDIKISLYNDNIPLFNYYNLENAIEKLLSKKVWLKCGGFLIVEQTEACVVIDVNTGKFAGKKSHDETIFRTNLEAATEICYQIKLRNLSGMIIIDFIDMKKEDDKNIFLDCFKTELSKDRVSTTIVGMTKLGLMQLTRKKTRERISNILQKQCSCCHGTGHVNSEDYTINKIYNDINDILSNTSFRKLIIKANENIINTIKGLTYFDNLAKLYNAKILTEIINISKIDTYEIVKVTK